MNKRCSVAVEKICCSLSELLLSKCRTESFDISCPARVSSSLRNCLVLGVRTVGKGTVHMCCMQSRLFGNAKCQMSDLPIDDDQQFANMMVKTPADVFPKTCLILLLCA